MRTFSALLIFVIYYSFSLSAACGDVIFVDVNSTITNPDGSNWNNAFSDVQSALDVAETCTEVQQIWIAGGTYKPTVDFGGGTTSGDRNLVYNIDFDVEIYGGFCGWEEQLYERIKYLCPTILSGDHDDDDIRITGITDANFPFTNGTDNSYNVIRMKNLTSATIIDGLRITGGNANHLSTLSKRIGGAIFNDGRGLNNTSNPRILNCVFEFNKAIEGGGAIYNYGVNSIASPSFITTEFRYNRSYTHGGALYNHGEGSAAQSNPIITSCIFERNKSANNGGAIYGEGASNGQSKPSIVQSTFVYNRSSLGPGLYIDHPLAGASLEFTVFGNIFYYNNASTLGAHSSFDGSNAIINTEYCLYPEAIVDQVNNNKNENPQFVSTTSNFRLQSNSVAIDNGEAAGFGLLTSDKDVDDNARKMGSLRDIGAYEYLTCPSNNTIYVNSSSANIRNGLSDATGLSSFNMALKMACDCNSVPVIHVSKGWYLPHRFGDLTFESNSFDHSFSVECPVDIRGQSGTVFSGDVLNNDGFLDTIGRGENCNTILNVINASIIIDSVEIRDGNAHGIYIRPNSNVIDVEVTHCSFYRNKNNPLFVESFADTNITIKVEDSDFYKNFVLGTATSDGCLKVKTNGYTDIEVSNCTFRDNEMGGLFLQLQDSSRSFMKGCLFENNSSYIGSGVEISNVGNQTSYHTISNCVFTDNTAEASGAAIYGRRSHDTHYDIYNCTFFRNFTDQNVSGAVNFFQSNGSAKVSSCIFWNNTNPTGLRGLSGDMDVSFSIIETASCPSVVRCNEAMMYEIDPLFEEENGTFGPKLSLKSNSPAINMGDRVIYNVLIMYGALEFDIAGNFRFKSNRVDLGAYEYQPIAGEDCPLSVTNPIAAPETQLSISALAQTSIELSQEYITPSDGVLFLDARDINIHPNLQIDSGAIVEVYTGGCSP